MLVKRPKRANAIKAGRLLDWFHPKLFIKHACPFSSASPWELQTWTELRVELGAEAS